MSISSVSVIVPSVVLPSDCPAHGAELARVYRGIHGAFFGYDSSGAWYYVGTFKNKTTTYEKIWEELKLMDEEEREGIIGAYVADNPLPLKIARGDDIQLVFNKYRPGSCMRGESNENLREVYVENPDIISAVYWESKSHSMLPACGSALVWTDSKRGRCYLDRTYSDGYAPGVIGYLGDAIAQILPHPVEMIYSNGAGWALPLVDRSTEVRFRLNLPNHGMLPYMDTLSNITYDSSDDRIVVSNKCGDFEARDVSGTDAREGAWDCRCCNCGEGLRWDDTRSNEYGDHYCESCYDDNFGYCEWSSTDYPIDEIQYVEIYEGGYRRHISIASEALSADFREYAGDNPEYAGAYIHESEAVETADSEYIHESEVGETEDKDTDCTYVVPLFRTSAYPVEDCAWSDEMGAWVKGEELAHWESIGRQFDLGTDGYYRKSIGIFEIRLSGSTGLFQIVHSATSTPAHDLNTYDYWRALRYAGRFISEIRGTIPELWAGVTKLDSRGYHLWFDASKRAMSVETSFKQLLASE